VAALSILERYEGGGDITLHVFSAELNQSDITLLARTLAAAKKRYRLRLELVDPLRLGAFPLMHRSPAIYFRLLAPVLLDVDRFLYCDVDTLCQMDLSPLLALDLAGLPIALAPEAPIHASPDLTVAEQLGTGAHGDYYNSGVMVVDCIRWREESLTQKCLAYLTDRPAKFFDQSALNYVLHGRIYPLPSCFNCRTNARGNWRAFLPPAWGEGNLLHFVDFPKPWSPYGRWAHPLGKLWWNCYRRTSHFQEGLPLHAGSRLRTIAAHWAGYRRTLKDKVLFSALASGWVHRVKGML
jgi:lipopolysaccharide biosynthesis glycosyltransferase